MNDAEKYEYRLIAAYERMMERIRAAAEEAELELRPRLAYLLETAQDKAVELGELSREEAQRIGDYLRRDIEDAAAFLARDGNGDDGDKTGGKSGELMDWLRLDLDIVEKRLLELFAGVADRTRLELLALEEQARAASDYHSSEITGIGTLRCRGCGHELRFHATARIPPCPHCRGTVFARTGH
jgi:hypothetical protein